MADMQETSGITSGEVIFFAIVGLGIAAIVWYAIKSRSQKEATGLSPDGDATSGGSNQSSGSSTSESASKTNQAEHDDKIKEIDNEIKEEESERRAYAAKLMGLFNKLHKKAKAIDPNIGKKDAIWKRIMECLEALHNQKADDEIMEALGENIKDYAKEFPDSHPELKEWKSIIENLENLKGHFNKEMEKLKEKEELLK